MKREREEGELNDDGEVPEVEPEEEEDATKRARQDEGEDEVAPIAAAPPTLKDRQPRKHHFTIRQVNIVQGGRVVIE